MLQNKRLSLPILLALPCLAAPLLAQAALPANALPGDGSVLSGTVTASVSGSSLDLTVGSSQAIINWGSAGGALNPVSGAGGFDVGSSASVTLQEGGGQTATASVLNLDVSGQPSQIDGSVLGHNVNVYIANENGVFVGATGRVSAPTVALMADGTSAAEAIFQGGSFGSGMASGALSLASGAQVQAGNVILSGNAALNLANAINANTITLHGEADLSGSLNANTVAVTGGFYGSGSLTANTLAMTLTGYVNDNKTGQILANGFTLDAGNSGTINISLTAAGSQAQGFNAFVNGNAKIDSGNSTVSVNSPNQNSRLILEVSGNLAVNPGSQSNPYGSGSAFQFPGLLYLEAWQNNVVNADLVNAYSASAPVGYGVFVISSNISDSHAIYANGSRGINFEGLWNGTGYNPAKSINGQNPSDASFSFTIPIYFAQNGTGGLSFAADSSITNPNTGYNQPVDLFLGNLPTLVAASTGGGSGITLPATLPSVNVTASQTSAENSALITALQNYEANQTSSNYNNVYATVNGLSIITDNMTLAQQFTALLTAYFKNPSSSTIAAIQSFVDKNNT
ncbi:MAG: hypothetical protein PHO57_11405 [Acidithiobacillus sp.]|nr:hypothetical protein [Acidithiobacillus sp.]